MCGRYGAAWDVEEMVAEFGVTPIGAAERLAPDYNVAPTKPVYVVTGAARADRRSQRSSEPHRMARESTEPRGGGDPHGGLESGRRLMVMRWGLVPHWARERSIGARLFNARVETAASTPAYRAAWAARRCLLPADGYYEWTAAAGGARQPFCIRRRDGRMLALAGLHETWRDPDLPADHPDALVRTCTVLTTAARGKLAEIHPRAPLLVPPSAYADWLDPAGPEDPEWLTGRPGPDVEAHPVSHAVNDVRRNGAALMDEVALYRADPLF